jgi:hypothetical protein
MTAARAMPIDTAVTATAVDNASAAVVINSTNRIERRLPPAGCGGAQPVVQIKTMDMGVSANQFRLLIRNSRRTAARVRPDLGEGID